MEPAAVGVNASSFPGQALCKWQGFSGWGEWFRGWEGGGGWESCSCYSQAALRFSSFPLFFLWSRLIDVSGQCHI